MNGMAEKTRMINVNFLEKLVNVPTPTGWEQPGQAIIREYLTGIADKITTDIMGNVIAELNPNGNPKIMLAGHVDEVGMQVRYITEKGFLHFHQLGGLDAHLLPGCRVKILSKQGEILGIIGKKAIHLQDPEERSKVVKLKEQFIDIGANSRDEVEKWGISIGDPIVFEDQFAYLGPNGIVVSRCFDDKVGSFIVMEILRNLKNTDFTAHVCAVSTVQEEIGTRGAVTSAFGVNPDVGIAYDVTFSTDSPDMKESDIGIVKIGGGPAVSRGPNINPQLFDLIKETAKELNITLQILAAPGPTGTDARSIQMTHGGVATALIQIPNRYMHSMSEVVHLDDVDAIVRLSVALIQKITKETSFIPQ
jgi:putative aminopeptidase FrvX